jgi:protein-S-isoprenylcysteine O-methyltransferase Ste14
MIVRLIAQTFVGFGAMGILLFIAAGTFAWPGAWTYLVLMVTLSLTLGIDLARNDPGLLQERMGSPVQRDQPAADKILLIALLLFLLAWLVLMGPDAKRFAWSSVPRLMQVLGALITLWSIWFCYRTMRENRLLLGSWRGVIFAFVLIGLLCIRIPIEEKVLRAGLVGYDEYAAHVRSRLIPHCGV